ncbi:MAG: lipid-A-disaccharide synthase [Gammaproteobacteria bacterium AqS3]|nr:lipid-A-disaccharide synthase [Gammaproteobacteria bacterium AqS3]
MTTEAQPLRGEGATTFGFCAPELSADRLGAGLLRSWRERFGAALAEGVGNTELQAAGLDCWMQAEELTVMGITDPLKRLPDLLRRRGDMVRRWCGSPPSAFIGIDQPDFNLPLARRLRARGIPTVHYVCPSIWAWRPGRVKTLLRSVDLVLCLFPFEAELLRSAGVRAEVVGHPLADASPAEYIPPEAARSELGLNPEQPCLGLLPGSRGSEIDHVLPVMARTAEMLQRTEPTLQILISAAGEVQHRRIEQCLPDVRWRIVEGPLRPLVLASDAVAVTSGTATLEVALLRRPMAVVWRASWLNHAILSRVNRSKWIALPNVLLGGEVVPELIQDEASPERLARELEAMLSDQGRRFQGDYERLLAELALGADERAAQALHHILEGAA